MIKKQLLKRIILTVISPLFSFLLFAQDSAKVVSNETSSVMRSHDKIYVVMAVCLTILVVLFLYLIRIDTKISKKESIS